MDCGVGCGNCRAGVRDGSEGWCEAMYRNVFPGQSGADEQDLWRQFESTGSVQEYLRYRQAKNAMDEESPDAKHGDGLGGQGAQGR